MVNGDTSSTSVVTAVSLLGTTDKDTSSPVMVTDSILGTCQKLKAFISPLANVYVMFNRTALPPKVENNSIWCIRTGDTSLPMTTMEASNSCGITGSVSSTPAVEKAQHHPSHPSFHDHSEAMVSPYAPVLEDNSELNSNGRSNC